MLKNEFHHSDTLILVTISPEFISHKFSVKCLPLHKTTEL
jgi:regulator of extracellular matrix RemA (YlzA/DUF370 family)